MRSQSEHEHQVALFEWAALIAGRKFKPMPELALMFAIPNGGHRNLLTAVKLKAEGVKAGIPDIFLPVSRHGYYGLFIELKRLKGGKTSGKQNNQIALLRSQGYRVEVCHGFEQAKTVILDYLEDRSE